ENSEVLKLKKFVVDDDKNTQTLRLEFESQKKVNNFKVFIEEIDGYTLFSAPFISLHDDKIYVRFEQLDKKRKADLLQSEFIITAVMNDKYYYRTTQISDSASAFDTSGIKLNLGLIWFAVLGGIILNFMPCVFPVLALKITALSALRGRRRKELRKSLWLNVGGIFCGFSILIILLLGLRLLGYSLGWGMQFQNISFVVCMALVMSSLIVALPRFGMNLNNMASKSKFSEFLIGNLTVLIATPCTAPYLAAAIGFALSSTNIDMIVILYAVALGLAMPYLLILLLKKPETFFPKPGAWMQKLEKITKLMLYLTIIWFLGLIYGQTGAVFSTIFAVMLVAFGALLYLCFEFIDYVEYKVQNIGIQSKYKVISGSYIFMLIIGGIFMLIGSYYAQKYYVKQQEINLQQREVSIDQKQIEEYLAQGHPVLLEITSDWCLTCHVNNALVLNKNNLENLHSMYNLELISVDWTNYNPNTLKFMAQYGRKGLPFYILYTPLIREGMVLPEVFNSNDLEQYLTYAVFR
ncbi:MAG: thioredoxin family protein, partial [Alphaproteobacteria bacterium]|nr:thioredoxin family protein [Alphaproteobacteria bacterium]